MTHPRPRPTKGDFVSEQRIARSTRHHRVDEAFVVLLEEDFGIEARDLAAAFIGVPSVPKKEAIALSAWAERVTTNPEDAGTAVRRWARKYGRGSYDPRLLDAPELTWGEGV